MGVLVGVGVMVGVSVCVGVAVAVSVAVFVGVGVGVKVAVEVAVGVGVSVAVGVGELTNKATRRALAGTEVTACIITKTSPVIKMNIKANFQADQAAWGSKSAPQ
jgi:hypothetical protein